jgi:CheY-like chemotaxis protein
MLLEFELDRQNIDLILSDMHLPDGTGLDVLRSVKNDARWRLTPVIILSSESDPQWIDGAYAAGAACYYPKSQVLETLESLCSCWLEHASLPQPATIDGWEAALSRSIFIRSQLSEYFLEVARTSKDASEIRFWLDRSLNEGNLANLFAFIKPLMKGRELSAKLLDRFTQMQIDMEEKLRRVRNLPDSRSTPDVSELCRAALELHGGLKEEIITELLDSLFRFTPESVSMVREYGKSQMTALANYILEKSDDPRLSEEAREMIAWSERLS